MSPSELTDLHVIRYELERDLMPLILANTQYSIEKGKETLHEYDLPKIQQQIMARFFLGKPLINLNVRIANLQIILPSETVKNHRSFSWLFFFLFFATGHSNTRKQT